MTAASASNIGPTSRTHRPKFARRKPSTAGVSPRRTCEATTRAIGTATQACERACPHQM
ncbi:MAG TPA: hypothetical protein VFY16_02630 [Gemmatimonadaceae bacterium]|nr:hypothetical protein [Gemmatimonadaceae bacterium]